VARALAGQRKAILGAMVDGQDAASDVAVFRQEMEHRLFPGAAELLGKILVN